MPHAAEPPATASDAPRPEDIDAPEPPVSEETPPEPGDPNAQPV